MSKALVIKGANFAQNAIEQISVSDPIPCTGITISQDSLTFTQAGATATLTATLTPADTTEAVTWVSSDENVVTVTAGQVTCVGVGEATITATCGSYQDTCAVTSQITVDANRQLYAFNGIALSSTAGRDYIGREEMARSRTYFDGNNTLNGYKAISRTEEEFADKYPIHIPKGTKTITITAPSEFDRSNWYYALYNANELTTYALSASAKGARAYQLTTGVKSQLIGDKRVATIDISNRDDAVNSFAFSIERNSSSDAASDVTGDVTIIFS